MEVHDKAIWTMQQPCEVPCFGRSRPERAMFARHNVDKTRLIATKSPNELLIPNATKVCLSHAPEVPLNRGNHISSMGKAVGIESANGPFNTCGWPRMTSFSESDTLQKPHRTHPTRKSGETMLATLGTNATSKFFPHLDIARTKLLWLRRLVIMFHQR